MIDTHCHVIWGVDDASQSEETTIKMLEGAKRDGIEKILCTPHCLPHYKYENDLVTLQKPFEQLKACIEKHQLGIEVLLGCEFFLTDQSLNWLETKRAVTLNGTNRLLIEFPWYQNVSNKMSETELIQATLAMGYRIIIAHPERYPSVQANFEILKTWRDLGCAFQVNRTSLLEMDQPLTCATAIRMMDEGFIDVIATDAHHESGNRIICLSDIYKKVVNQYDQKIADLWLIHNPQALIEGSDLKQIKDFQ